MAEGGALCGVVFTLALIVWAGFSLKSALEEGRRFKAVVLGIVIALLALLCLSGGYVGFSTDTGYTDCGVTNSGAPYC